MTDDEPVTEKRFRESAEAEERGLFYVAMTRASDTVAVVHDLLRSSTHLSSSSWSILDIFFRKEMH